jgi:hypothetical protein
MAVFFLLWLKVMFQSVCCFTEKKAIIISKKKEKAMILGWYTTGG